MGFVKDNKVSMIGRHAQRAIEEGRTVFVARINNPVGDGGGFSGPVSAVAEQIEAVEAQGWWLQNMSYCQDRSGRNVEGYYLFRRR